MDEIPVQWPDVFFYSFNKHTLAEWILLIYESGVSFQLFMLAKKSLFSWDSV